MTDHEDLTLQNGVPGSLYNPEARWDWWQIGGRWSNELPIKPDVPRDEIDDPDQMPAYYVNFEDSPDKAQSAEEFWENYVEGKNPDKVHTMLNRQYYIDQYGSKENYVQACSEFGCFAFITPEGEWFEQGTMGWFGCSSATMDSRTAYREALKKMICRAETQNLWVTMVDCHI